MSGGTVICLALLVAGCGWSLPGAGSPRPATAGTAGGAFEALAKASLRLPRIGPGGSCPRARLSQTDPQVGMGLGDGPAYLLGGWTLRSDPGHPQKVAWAVAPGYRGPLRIRGGQVDGGGRLYLGAPDNHWRGAPVRTVEGTELYPELDLLETHTSSNPPTAWRVWPSAAYIATSGCYAWQVDGLGFTEIVTLEVLQVPALSPGEACPVSPRQVAHDLSSQFSDVPALGSGPVYALMAAVLTYSQSDHEGGWSSQKVLWAARPGLEGEVLIRGRQLEGPEPVGFGMGDDPDSALRWRIDSRAGWANLPSEVRIRAPGCYAYQVDSPGGIQVIVFQVV